ncbi:hypothetical protein [Synechocystis sp. LEGE 06083]|nr:hypothetical protein [Synechocystis sp. LEGE 06083]
MLHKARERQPLEAPQAPAAKDAVAQWEKAKVIAAAALSKYQLL